MSEFLATLFFLLTCLIAIWNPDSLLSVALGSGLAFAFLIHMFYGIAEGFFNPAISVALLVNGQMSLLKCTLCVIAQVLGAIAGAGVVKLSTLDLPRELTGRLIESEDIFDR